jgi:excisionase family DNA binding protein
MDQYLKTSEVMKLLNVSRNTITRLIESGELKAFQPVDKIGSGWRISEVSLKEFLDKKTSL